MLQQTQVKTVIPYWERWMRELPTIQHLAKAPPAKIHKLWEGLGYYTRVRNLQTAAQQIVASCKRRAKESQPGKTTSHVVRHKKSDPFAAIQFPENFDNVLALPGIGRYTAGAICSIAFNQPKPILDGNVVRVLTRLFGIAKNPRETKTNAHLWQLAEELVLHASRLTHRASPSSHLNQSLMELGALVCTPRSPQCDACPVNELCIARKLDLQNQLPNLRKPAAAVARRFLAFVIERDGRFLVRQRPAGVVNAHLWEFPNLEAVSHSSSSSNTPDRKPRTRTSRRERFCAPDFRPTSGQPLCTIKHSITRSRITLEVWRAELANLRTQAEGYWLTLPQLHKLAFTGAHKQILTRLALAHRSPPRRVPDETSPRQFGAASPASARRRTKR